VSSVLGPPANAIVPVSIEPAINAAAIARIHIVLVIAN